MNESVGHHPFVAESAKALVAHLELNTPDVKTAVKAATGAQTDEQVEEHRIRLVGELSGVRDKVAAETRQPYVHFASRVDIVGLYQSALSRVFTDMPGLQGYGNMNAIWAITPIEQLIYKVKDFFHEVRHLTEGKKTVLQAVLQAWGDLKTSRATYPTGTPNPLPLDEHSSVALLADWGGDNDAAKNVAEVVRRANPKVAIHLGDIYYGGVKSECEAFLRNWPLQADARNSGVSIPAGSSYALNGNHEMYSGGESYFNVVLPAFNQKQPFFCLEGEHWRLIGLDTAYSDGRLKPTGPDDPIAGQWSWLINLLKTGPKRANIFLTHHEPVSSHKQEFSDSTALRNDVAELLAMEGIGPDAIFAWFFGHEHRFTVYDDNATPYNARLIGSGCIPHEIQREVESDPGCTPFRLVSNRGEGGSTESAISLYAELRFQGPHLTIVYTDERSTSLAHEEWDAKAGRMNTQLIVDNSTYWLT